MRACVQGGGAIKARQQNAVAAAADLVAAREDAEFQQKASLEVMDVPNTIPAFKCGPPPLGTPAAAVGDNSCLATMFHHLLSIRGAVGLVPLTCWQCSGD